MFQAEAQKHKVFDNFLRPWHFLLDDLIFIVLSCFRLGLGPSDPGLGPGPVQGPGPGANRLQSFLLEIETPIEVERFVI